MVSKLDPRFNYDQICQVDCVCYAVTCHPEILMLHSIVDVKSFTEGYAKTVVNERKHDKEQPDDIE